MQRIQVADRQIALPVTFSEDETTSRSERDYKQERLTAIDRRSERIVNLRLSRSEGTLGDEVFRLTQILLLCGLPYSSTDERSIVRSSKLSDGSVLRVTFNANRPGIKLPFGADRRFLTYILHRALHSKSRFVTWAGASEYLKEMGLCTSGKNMKDLRDRFDRISGLAMTIERTVRGNMGTQVPVISRWNLPWCSQSPSEDEWTLQEQEQYGFKIGEELWEDIQRHNVVLPKGLWIGTKGSWRQQDAILWLCYRCSSARGYSFIPFDAIKLQFPQDESNPWRLKSLFEGAIVELKSMWPGATVSVTKQEKTGKLGIAVDEPEDTFLPEDAGMNRVLRVPLKRRRANEEEAKREIGKHLAQVTEDERRTKEQESREEMRTMTLAKFLATTA